MPRGTRAFLVSLAFLAAAPACSRSPGDRGLIAIDILVEPDSIMVARAQAVNARLRENYPPGFALDASHAPHITLVQRYVRAADLDAIGSAVSRVIAAERAMPLRLTASSYGGVVWAGVGLVDYAFAPSPALDRLAAKVVAAVEPFAVRGGTGDAFHRAPGEQINAPTIAYVEHFVPQSSGPNFRPHVTVGNAQPGFLGTLQAEPFESFDFAGVNVAIYQLGNYGTAQQRLWSWADTPPPSTRSHLGLVLTIILLFAALLGAILLSIQVGRRLGRARLARDGEGAFAGLGAMEGAVFALLGLLLAFSFSHAATRFDERRQLAVEEANDVGTAWLRLDLLHDSIQPAIRQRFRDYVGRRLAAYRSFPDIALVERQLDSAVAMQRGIWDLAVAGAQRSALPAPATQLVLPALNDVFDIATTRRAAFRRHTPTVVFVMLGVLTLVCSVLAGVTASANASHTSVHAIAFALLLVASLYVILDLEFPRFGLVRVDAFDQVLVDVHAGMVAPP